MKGFGIRDITELVISEIHLAILRKNTKTYLGYDRTSLGSRGKGRV